MQTIDTYNFQGKKALIRVDFNVPLNDKFEITDDILRCRAPHLAQHRAERGCGHRVLDLHFRQARGEAHRTHHRQ